MPDQTDLEDAQSARVEIVETAADESGPQFRWTKVQTGLILAILALLCIAARYVSLARRIDRRLAVGPFAASTDILSAGETISVGEPLTLGELVTKLQRAGLTTSPKNADGWFEVRGNTVEIAQRDGFTGPVRVEFSAGKIAAMADMRTHMAAAQYRIKPQLLANLSEAREKRRLVRFSEIPASLVQALTSVEDKHFFSHGGLDVGRIVKAAYVDFRDGRKQQGASTLTMQLARSLWLDPGKSWRRKMEELLITLHLERSLSKQQIFEDYANEIYLGRRGTFSINGFGEGAHAFFGKELWQIDMAEAALLAGLVQRPSYYNPVRYPDRAVNRRNQVLGLMRRDGKLSGAAYQAAVNEPLHLAPEADSANSYFLALVNEELQTRLGDSTRHPRSVLTTIEPELQRAAEDAVRSGMATVDLELRRQNPRATIPAGQPQVALIALDPHTGEIKALVGGRDYAASQLNHVFSMRQPGSVFKPFVYTAAIDTAVDGGARRFTPATMLADESTTFRFGKDSYAPHDYHGDYQGDVTLRTALAQSLNVPTVSLAQQVGYASVVAMARRAGLPDTIKPTPSVALGAYETTPLEIAAAYTVFANQGVWVRPTAITEVRGQNDAVLYQHSPETRAALDPKVAYIMVNLMQEVLRSGTGARVRWQQGFTLPAAGKTGTSRDGWFAGFTTELLCVVWVGFDDNRELNLEGARSALPIWAAFMKRAAQIRPYSSAHEFAVPPGVVSAQICTDSGQLAGPDCPNTRPEVFIWGTEPHLVCDMHHTDTAYRDAIGR